MEQGNLIVLRQSNLSIESGILRESLLSLKKELFPDVELSFSIAYKHYILFFLWRKTQGGEDCIVFDTQKGTTVSLNTGLNMSERAGYSFLYWRHNIFVLYGGTLREQAGPVQGISRDTDLKFLNVIEDDGMLSSARQA